MKKYSEISDQEWDAVSDQKSVALARKFCEMTGFDKEFDLVDGAWHTEFHWTEGNINYELRFDGDAIDHYQLLVDNNGSIVIGIYGIPIAKPIPDSLYTAIRDLMAT